MFASLRTVAFSGIAVEEVEVQVHFAQGQPSLSIVGLANKSVSEAKDRVRSAISSMGLFLPPKRVTINLAPADIIKDGSHYDLPIALGILACMGVIDHKVLEKSIIIGELSLDGRINYVNGALPSAVYAYEKNLQIIAPRDCASEVMFVNSDIMAVLPENISEIVQHFSGYSAVSKPEYEPLCKQGSSSKLCFSDVKGQRQAKRALEIAATGMHNVLMTGLPGSGKSMLAQRISSIMPTLTPNEMLEIGIINSISGNIKEVSNERPFRSPHHSCSMPSMVGGGKRAKPGEITLAHNGILFLDEFAEYPSIVLDSLRQPMETGEISIARADNHITYPAGFQLIAAMNPCKCGYLGDESRQCSKVPLCADEYRRKISGPILERIDIHVTVNPNTQSLFESSQNEETSETIIKRVIKALEFARQRFGDNTRNGKMTIPQIESFCKLDEASRTILQNATQKLKLSMRQYHKILRVSRTIADLAANDAITKEHILEALSYRG